MRFCLQILEKIRKLGVRGLLCVGKPSRYFRVGHVLMREALPPNLWAPWAPGAALLDDFWATRQRWERGLNRLLALRWKPFSCFMMNTGGEGGGLGGEFSHTYDHRRFEDYVSPEADIRYR